jgi:hypothetical protein
MLTIKDKINIKTIRIENLKETLNKSKIFL